MPRPGPRPYECVRRAWHSDRHQPMRGSLIQEIFRIASETHSPSTKKKEEWQEKLPIVVLKAEEIIYSKANSEAEYIDPKTLLERVNDAIDTIIRRDHGTETDGMFLQPCIEAALNLGCIARRASRSQRNSDPSFYLGSYSLGTASTNYSMKSLSGGGTTTMPISPSPLAFQYSNFSKGTSNPAYPENNCCFSIKGQLPVSNSGSYYPNGTFSSYPLFYGFCPPSVTMSTTSECNKKEQRAEIEPLPTRMAISEKDNDEDDQYPVSNDLLGGPPELVVCDLALRLAPLSVSSSCQWPTVAEGKKLAAGPNVINGEFSSHLKKRKEFPAGDFVTASQPNSSMLWSGSRKRRAVEPPSEGSSNNLLWKPKLLCSSSSLSNARGAKA